MTNDKSTVIQEEQCFFLSHAGDHEPVVLTARRMAARIGFNSTDEVMIATAASELATNILRYAQKGEVCLRIINRHDRSGIEIIASDQGPGIENVELALQDHYTTTPKSLGLGLPSVKRIMDEFLINSDPDAGTYIAVRKWK
jgi:serine/threonine-protein kinase RsbT